MDYILILIYTILGTLMGGLLSMIPALHIFNVAGIALLAWWAWPQLIPEVAIPAFFMSQLVAWSIINTIPSMFFGAPDEAAVFVVLPGQKYMLQGRGYEAAILTGVGSLAAIIVMALLTPFCFYALPAIIRIRSQNLGWILLLFVTYMIMSEWPKGSGLGRTRWEKFKWAWANLIAGLGTMALAGFMGFIILNRTFVPLEMSFQGIMPVFVGLFAVAIIARSIVSHEKVPAQYISSSIDLDHCLLAKGVFAGTLGGGIAAVTPCVTGGIGGIIAGAATGQRDDRIFVVSQGVSKVIYYVGAFLLFFVPTIMAKGGGLARGGMTIILKPVFTPYTFEEYYQILAVMMISGALSFFMMFPLTRWTIKLITRVDYHYIYFAALAIIFIIVWSLTGWMGMFLMAVGTGIGLIPAFYHSRLSNSMALLLIWMALSMAGHGPAVLKFFHLD
ncbi:MAG: tripartite tricarboxylate transporter permease [Candidatus Aureabacteria bacterium]|nr:tripartite tricarboxylate transporter permease [Candidatus Auribacterota bacterium]